MGITGVILEDQKRPRKCGHLGNKVLLDVDEYLLKLNRVLATRKDLFVVARTDASEIDDILLRTQLYSETNVDAILVDGVKDLNIIRKVQETIDKPIVFNNIAGGKSPMVGLDELKQAGVSLVNYSTPCLFTAQSALEQEMQ